MKSRERKYIKRQKTAYWIAKLLRATDDYMLAYLKLEQSGVCGYRIDIEDLQNRVLKSTKDIENLIKPTEQ